MRHLLLATLRRVHGDQGQMVVFGVLFLAMFAASGLAIVDVGSWYAARRDAQADADFIALAGALELPSFDDDAGAVVRAQTAAADWALANDVDPLDPDVALTVQVVDDCYSANDEVHTGVRVTVQRVPKSYFIAFFPGVSPSVSAVAQACSGTPQEMTGFVPWALPLAGDCFEDDPLTPGVRVPIYGARCDIIVSAGTPSVGQLGFKDPGGCADGDSGGSYKGNIVTGVDRRCSVGDSVSSNPGINVGQTQKGIEDRLLTEGACATLAIPISGKVDSDTVKFNLHPTLEDLLNPGAGGIDDFFEVWGPGLGYDVAQHAEKLVPYECDSPRNVVVIVIQDIGIGDGVGCTGVAGSFCYEIQGFARVYIEGCSSAPSGFKPACDIVGAGSSFTVHARFVDTAALSSSHVELSRFGDTLTFLKD